MLTDLISLFFPRLCCACGFTLLKEERLLCTHCRFQLPRTGYYNIPDNPVAKLFWGRIPLEHAGAYLFFKKGGRVQTLLHNLKYKGMKEAGTLLGELYGKDLLHSKYITAVDIVVPVPLHPDKFKKRGYNQSATFAKGLSLSLGAEFDEANLYRSRATATQTKKSRYERWLNVEEIFSVSNPLFFEGKHVLLADDVITTGATIEACASALLKIPGCMVSAVSIAVAK